MRTLLTVLAILAPGLARAQSNTALPMAPPSAGLPIQDKWDVELEHAHALGETALPQGLLPAAELRLTGRYSPGAGADFAGYYERSDDGSTDAVGLGFRAARPLTERLALAFGMDAAVLELPETFVSGSTVETTTSADPKLFMFCTAAGVPPALALGCGFTDSTVVVPTRSRASTGLYGLSADLGYTAGGARLFGGMSLRNLPVVYTDGWNAGSLWPLLQGGGEVALGPARIRASVSQAVGLGTGPVLDAGVACGF